MNNKHLVWMDLEMTGLDPETDVILELATIITDQNLNIVAEGPNLVVHQPDAVLESMNEWCKQHHGESGLTQRVRESALTLEDAEAETLRFVQAHVGERVSPLCGNSIHQDRRFLVKYMPKLDAWFHYRNVDVSTVKELVNRWYPDVPQPAKSGQHLALADIRESINELRYYRDRVFVKNGG